MNSALKTNGTQSLCQVQSCQHLLCALDTCVCLSCLMQAQLICAPVSAAAPSKSLASSPGGRAADKRRSSSGFADKRKSYDGHKASEDGGVGRKLSAARVSGDGRGRRPTPPKADHHGQIPEVSNHAPRNFCLSHVSCIQWLLLTSIDDVRLT